jgi:hypothetical protein
MSLALYPSRVRSNELLGGISWENLSNCPRHGKCDNEYEHSDLMAACGVAPLVHVLIGREKRHIQHASPEQDKKRDERPIHPVETTGFSRDTETRGHQRERTYKRKKDPK